VDDTQAFAKGLSETMEPLFSLRTLFDTCCSYASQMLEQLHLKDEVKDIVKFKSSIVVRTAVRMGCLVSRRG